MGRLSHTADYCDSCPAKKLIEEQHVDKIPLNMDTYYACKMYYSSLISALNGILSENDQRTSEKCEVRQRPNEDMNVYLPICLLDFVVATDSKLSVK